MDLKIFLSAFALIACASGQADVEQMIKHAYCHCLSRCPDTYGLQNFTKLYHSSDGDMREVCRGLAKSPEFYTKRIASEPTKHPVEILYKIFLLREVDAEGKSYWVKKIKDEDEIKQGNGFHRCVDGVINSNEFKKKMPQILKPGLVPCQC